MSFEIIQSDTKKGKKENNNKMKKKNKSHKIYETLLGKQMFTLWVL
jgi:hypothetical protein